MNDWGYAQNDPRECLARLHYFSFKKLQDETEIEMTITVKEFWTHEAGAPKFFAQADKQTNQKVAPYTPSGWGSSMLDALSQCIREIHRFPYQG